jgi:AMP phosphorylase
MLLVPIIASCGLKIPKTSSRAITSPAGTADRMEILAPVELGIEEIKGVVRRTGGCLVWGGAIDLAPADDLFIQIENPLSLDPLMLPSVMSKKKAVGSKYVVIDIPTGSGAKVKKSGFRKLSGNFKTLGKKLGIKVDCISTKGNQPIGYAIGPALEAREALETIMGLKSPKDLINKALLLSGSLLKMCKKGNIRTAEKILRSGKAEEKLREIIACQGGYEKIKPGDIPYADNMAEIRSKKSGVVSCIDDDTMAYLARIAGTPKDKLAGVVLNKKIGNKVKRGEVLFTIYAQKKHKLKSAMKYVDKTRIYHVV